MPRKATGKPPGRPKTCDWREFARLVERGVGLEDAQAALGVPASYARAQAERFERETAKGHALFRTSLAKRLHREAVFRGRSFPLLAAAKRWLPGYERPTLDQQQQFATVSREQAIDVIARAVLAVRRNHPHARSVGACDVHKRVFACPECTEPGVILTACCADHDVEARLARGYVEEHEPEPELTAEDGLGGSDE